MKLVVLGLSLSSSWGNGHATTYRGLVRELANRGHDVRAVVTEDPRHLVMIALCDANCCVRRGRLTAFDFELPPATTNATTPPDRTACPWSRGWCRPAYRDRKTRMRG